MNEFFGAAKERGVQQFLAIVCSPPARMARNGLTFVSPGPHTPNLKPGYEGQFARYMAEILDHFRSNPDSRERIDFNYISRVNAAMGMGRPRNRSSNEDVKAIVRSLGEQPRARDLSSQIATIESGNIPHMFGPDTKTTSKYGRKFGDYLRRIRG